MFGPCGWRPRSGYRSNLSYIMGDNMNRQLKVQKAMASGKPYCPKCLSHTVKVCKNGQFWACGDCEYACNPKAWRAQQVLKDYGRNSLCYCGSGKKVKRCCKKTSILTCEDLTKEGVIKL